MALRFQGQDCFAQGDGTTACAYYDYDYDGTTACAYYIGELCLEAEEPER